MPGDEKKIMGEHRLFVRYNLSSRVVLQAQEGIPRTVAGELIDISFRGIGVYVQQPFDKESQVSFAMPQEKLFGSGKVVYLLRHEETGRYRVGIEFFEVDSVILRDLIFRLQQNLGSEKPQLE